MISEKLSQHIKYVKGLIVVAALSLVTSCGDFSTTGPVVPTVDPKVGCGWFAIPPYEKLAGYDNNSENTDGVEDTDPRQHHFRGVINGNLVHAYVAEDSRLPGPRSRQCVQVIFVSVKGASQLTPGDNEFLRTVFIPGNFPLTDSQQLPGNFTIDNR